VSPTMQNDAHMLCASDWKLPFRSFRIPPTWLVGIGNRACPGVGSFEGCSTSEVTLVTALHAHATRVATDPKPASVWPYTWPYSAAFSGNYSADLASPSHLWNHAPFPR
jgi:hypothetical protein